MLKDLPKILILIAISSVLMLTIFHFATRGFHQDSIVQTLSETLRSTAIANRDDSARVNRGQFRLQTENFETEFIHNFKTNSNVVFEASEAEFIFDYLHDGEGGVQAIQVQLIKNEKIFQATVVVDVADD
jgi:hypothetical protein